ncbi:MAG: type I-E CRISPR-associated protein Cas6/Cse3/CasE [Flexilinea sp.]
MFLSKLTLNPQNNLVQRDISNPYNLHQRLYSAFPSDIANIERLLFRLEYSHKPPYLVILMQSKLIPDWGELERVGYLSQSAQIKSYEPHFQIGQRLTFRLVANPTRRLKSDNKEKIGKRIGLIRVEDQQVWIQRKASENGFSLQFVNVTNLSDQIAYKKGLGNRITQHGVRFDGLLEITNADLFAQCVVTGIGSAKGFGFGLLSVAPSA